MSNASSANLVQQKLLRIASRRLVVIGLVERAARAIAASAYTAGVAARADRFRRAMISAVGVHALRRGVRRALVWPTVGVCRACRVESCTIHAFGGRDHAAFPRRRVQSCVKGILAVVDVVDSLLVGAAVFIQRLARACVLLVGT